MRAWLANWKYNAGYNHSGVTYWGKRGFSINEGRFPNIHVTWRPFSVYFAFCTPWTFYRVSFGRMFGFIMTRGKFPKRGKPGKFSTYSG